MVNFKINENIYNVPIVFSIGDWKESREFLYNKYKLRIKEQENYGGQTELYNEEGWAMNMIWLPIFNYNEPIDIAVLVHEIDHAVQNIMDIVKIPFVADQNNHAYVYLKEYFLREALKKLKKIQETNSK